MISTTESRVDFLNTLDRTELIDVIRSAPGPWHEHRIEQKSRDTLERLALLAQLTQTRRTGPTT